MMRTIRSPFLRALSGARRLSGSDRVFSSAELTSIINTTIKVVGALCFGLGGSYILSNALLESIKLSKPGSAEETAAMNKVRKTAEATAAGAVDGALSVSGTPGGILRYLLWWTSPPSKDEDPDHRKR